MKIHNIRELETLALVNQDVYDVLTDLAIGRRSASNYLTTRSGYEISEKLIRTYRKNLAEEEDTTSNVLPLFKSVEDAVAVPIRQGRAQSSKTIVIMPDVQAPLHDVQLVNKFVKFLGDFQPEELAQVGDFTDSTEISRWVRGKKQEFAGDLQGGFDASIQIFKDIRSVFDGRFRMVRSNHDDRLELYLEACAPGLNLRDLTLERQLRMDEHDVEFIRDGLVELATDWVMGHGDEGSLSPQAGKTAFGLAKNKFGVNVVCGHTHRAGITSESYGYNGKITRSLTGLEVGHFMDLKQAHYLAKKGGAANWQQAFGILEIIHGKVFPHLINVYDGNFSVEGQMY